ncbi:MAG: pentapeptide repeat-containing protein [Cyanobacteria bacterium P01_G01_bin.54]
MPLELIKISANPDLATLDLTWVPDGSQVQLNSTIQVQPCWLPIAPGQVQISLKAVHLLLKLPPSADVAQIHREIRYLDTLATATQHRWQIAPLPQGELAQTVPLVTLAQPSESFQVRLSVAFSDFHITETQGLLPREISPNRLAVVQRAIAQRIWQMEFKSALSIVSTDLLPPLAPPMPLAISGLIQPVLEAPSDRFTDLVALTNLDLSQDFQQANLLGVNLAEADLSGANLVGANLRGAELCDADLREANLSSANLQGADLSGALLEDANLTAANGYRASFALANFAGANLTQANFQETNLAQTNWHGAIVTALRLGENQGLSAENQDLLLGQGAMTGGD